jgi:hypothetical protein
MTLLCYVLSKRNMALLQEEVVEQSNQGTWVEGESNI